MIYASESHKQPRNLKILFLSLLLLISTYVTICLGAGLSDMPFIQEYHKAYPIAPDGTGLTFCCIPEKSLLPLIPLSSLLSLIIPTAKAAPVVPIGGYFTFFVPRWSLP